MSAALATLTKNMAARFDLGEANGQELMDALKATAFKGPVSEAQMTALILVAQQYQLNPWTREIYALPDRNNGIVPVVGVDGWARIINGNPQFDGMEFSQDNDSCTCIIYRKDRTHPTKVTEWMAECRRANVGPWQSHPKRMLRHKAMIQCARMAFGFTGIYDQDEAERIVGNGNPLPSAGPLQTLSEVLAKVKAQLDDDFSWIDRKAFTREELAQIKAACAQRRQELNAVVADINPTQPDNTNWLELIERAESADALEAVENSIPDDKKAEFSAIIKQQREFLAAPLPTN